MNPFEDFLRRVHKEGKEAPKASFSIPKKSMPKIVKMVDRLEKTPKHSWWRSLLGIDNAARTERLWSFIYEQIPACRGYDCRMKVSPATQWSVELVEKVTEPRVGVDGVDYVFKLTPGQEKELRRLMNTNAGNHIVQYRVWSYLEKLIDEQPGSHPHHDLPRWGLSGSGSGLRGLMYVSHKAETDEDREPDIPPIDVEDFQEMVGGGKNE